MAKVGRDAAENGDQTKACMIFTSLRKCGAALDGPNSLRMLQIVGKHWKETADTNLQKSGCKSMK